jgi:predicted alpha-1,2-mannosidase
MNFRSKASASFLLFLLSFALPSCFGDFDTFVWTRAKRVSATAPLVDYVDPFIGTSGVWWAAGHVSPAAAVPFGQVKLGPDSSVLGKTLSHSGYAKNDPELVGFSLTRYSGTGVGEGGILRVKPLNQEENFKRLKSKRYIADKRTEMARAGYYSVYLHAEKIKVELTASKRVGVHRYIFNQPNPRLVVELSSAHKGEMQSLNVNVTPTGFEGTGELRAGFSGRYHGLPVYFIAELSHPVEDHRYVQKNATSADAALVTEGAVETYLDLGIDAQADEEIILRIGISHTSLAAAQAHLNGTSADFASVRELAEESWQAVLEKILVEGGTTKDKVIFYSALYRSFLMPTEFSDEDGTFFGGDKQTHAPVGHPYYSDFSLWDTFRTVHPLYSLIARDEHADMLESLLIIYQQTGRLTRWFSGAGHTGSMLGVPAVITLSEAYQKGLTGFDQVLALEAMQAALDPTIKTKGKECLSQYVELGFCSTSQEGSVSYTLEYAYGDHALSLYADAIGEDVLAEKHGSRAKKSVTNHFDKRHMAFLPKLASGEFEDLGPKGPSWDDTSYLKLGRTGRAYVEGGPRHWRFYSFYDDELLRSLYGKHFEPLLDETFAKAKSAIGSAFPPYYYWHGNEPGFTQAYSYSLNGNLKKTQKWVKWILQNKYSEKSNGLDGDDDAGTLSAWYVFSAMGFFPIAGTDRYIIGYPVFDKVTINIDGDLFTIEKKSSNISQVYLNGNRLSKFVFRHEDLVDGGTLTFGGTP